MTVGGPCLVRKMLCHIASQGWAQGQWAICKNPGSTTSSSSRPQKAACSPDTPACIATQPVPADCVSLRHHRLKDAHVRPTGSVGQGVGQLTQPVIVRFRGESSLGSSRKL